MASQVLDEPAASPRIEDALDYVRFDEIARLADRASSYWRSTMLAAERGEALTVVYSLQADRRRDARGLRHRQDARRNGGGGMTDPFDIGDLDNDALDAEALRQDALRAPQLLPPPSMPMDVARVFVEKACLTDGLLTLHHWRGGWWVWRHVVLGRGRGSRGPQPPLSLHREGGVPRWQGRGAVGAQPPQDRRSHRSPCGDLHPASGSRPA